LCYGFDGRRFIEVTQRDVLASLLENRRLSLLLVGAAVFQLAAVLLFDAGWWHCPVKGASGWPCPGCGLSTAGAALLQGEIGLALELHAFAPFLIIALGLLLAVSLLPGRARARCIRVVRHLETRYWMSAIILVALLAYGMVRLIF